MTRAVPLLALLCACAPPRNLTPIIGHAAGSPCNSRGVCLDEPTLLPAADLALVLLAHAAIDAGHSYERTAAAIRRPLICLVQRPEPCCAYGACQPDSDGAVRDKAGCAIPDGAMWVSKEWPAGTVRDWRPDMLHELSHLVAAALGVEQRRDHQDAWAAVEARAQAAFAAALR